MSQYKRLEVNSKHGPGVRYMYKEGSRFMFVARDALPQRVRARLDELPPGEIIDDNPDAPPPVQKGRACIMCGEQGTRRKFVHLQVVFLCDEHYHSKTTGEIGAKVKELQDAEA